MTKQVRNELPECPVCGAYADGTLPPRWWKVEAPVYDENGVPTKETKEVDVSIYEVSDMIAILLCKEYLGLTHKMKMFVVCNDVFSWGTADAEPITWDEIGDVFDLMMEHGYWGPVMWCIKKRRIRPQKPMREAIKKAGLWEPWLDNLAPNADEQ